MCSHFKLDAMASADVPMPWEAAKAQPWSYEIDPIQCDGDDRPPQLEVFQDQELGKGAGHVVYKASLDGVAVAAKSLRRLQWPAFYEINCKEDVLRQYRSGCYLDVLLREIDIHSKLSLDKGLLKTISSGLDKLKGVHDFNDNMVKFKGLFWEELYGVPVPRWVVMEFCNGGTLQHRLDCAAEGNFKLQPREVCDTLYTVIGTLEYIHRAGCIHRDIKPANILFHDGTVKVADFGFSREVHHEMTVAGTPFYQAPEVMSGHYDQSIDVYSLAVVAMEMAAVATPGRILEAAMAAARGNKDLFKVIIQELGDDSLYLKPLLETVLKSPAGRPSSGQLLIRASISGQGDEDPKVVSDHTVAKWQKPESYSCTCKKPERGGCPHSAEPQDDRQWWYCYTCKKVFDKRCSDQLHSFEQFEDHKGYLMPPPAPVRFDDVVERIFKSQHWLQGTQAFHGIGKLCLMEGGEVVLNVMGKQVMFNMALKEVAGQQTSQILKNFVENFNGNTVAQYVEWIQNHKNIKLAFGGMVVEAGEGASQAFMDRSLKQLAEKATASACSVSALKTNALMSAVFAAAEIGYLAYQHWGRKSISWTEFKHKSYEALVGQATSAITSWAGAAASGLLAASLLGPVGVTLAIVFGGIVGGAAGQYVGRRIVHEFLPPYEESKANARSIVNSMDALNIWVDDPKDMQMDQVKSAFHELAKQIHPDKVLQKPGETHEQYQQRKATSNLHMSLLNHHYKLLKAYIENRDKTDLWEHVPVGEHWQDKMKQKSLKLIA